MAANQQPKSPINHERSDEYKWQLVKGSKRNNSSPKENPVIKKKQLSIRDYWLTSTTEPVQIENPFDALKDSENENKKDKTSEDDPSKSTSNLNTKTPRVPPIFVSGVQNIKPLTDVLNKTAKNKYTLKILHNEEVKISVENSESYNLIITELQNRGTLFYTFQKKEDKPYRVVLKNLHPSVDINELKSEIEFMGHKVIRISNVKHRTTKHPLPIFFIELETNNESNKKIFEITKLLNQIISFEPPYKKRDVPQCMRCQEYGHTKNYCKKIPVCVKCAKNHLTSECQIKEKIKEVKCANCGGDHVASYKGCIIRKQLQQKLFPSLRLKQLNNNTTLIPQEIKINQNNVQPNVTYAQATNINTQTSQKQAQVTVLESKHKQETVDINSQLAIMMSQLMSKMDTMLNLLTILVNKMN